jgi:hypothetical protein
LRLPADVAVDRLFMGRACIARVEAGSAALDNKLWRIDPDSLG